MTESVKNGSICDRSNFIRICEIPACSLTPSRVGDPPKLNSLSTSSRNVSLAVVRINPADDILELDQLDKLELLLDLLLLELDEDDILELELLDELDEHERKANSILVISNPPSSLNSN